MAHTLQERYSSTIVALARKYAATTNLFNTDYEGDPTAGSIKIPVRNTEVTVRDYDTTTGVALEQGTTTYLTIAIGADKGVNEIIDKYEASAVPDNLAAQRLDSASYAMSLNLDTEAITTLEAEGTTSADTTQSGITTAYGNFMDEQLELDLVDVPRDGRFGLLSPTFYSQVKQNIVTISQDALADSVITTGLLGTLDGVPVYMSNNMAVDTEFIIANQMWTQECVEWTVPVAINDLTNTFIGSSAVQGRYVYEYFVTKATAVRVKTFV